MRRLIDLATTKVIQRQLRLLGDAGIQLERGPSHRERFEEEMREEFHGQQDLMRQIQDRCYWKVVIRPETYTPDRLSFAELRTIIDNNMVSIRGWNFPHLEYDRGHDLQGAQWWGQFISWRHFQEVWRLFRSGQFEFVGGLNEDWSKPGQFVDAQLG
jgi:hypothetical protein